MALESHKPERLDVDLGIGVQTLLERTLSIGAAHSSCEHCSLFSFLCCLLRSSVFSVQCSLVLVDAQLPSVKPHVVALREVCSRTYCAFCRRPVGGICPRAYVCSGAHSLTSLHAFTCFGSGTRTRA